MIIVFSRLASFCADVAFWQMSLFFPSLYVQLFLYYRCVFRPIGVHLGLREGKRRKANTNDILETTYAKSKIVDPTSLQGLSDQLGMTTRQIERWFRVRRLQNKPTTLDKFAETG